MSITAKLDDLGKPAWIGLMILSFMAYWPAGLAVLAYLIWSGRMRSWKQGGFGRWQQAGMDRMQGARDRWCGGARHTDTSGNHAFDEYRNETLRRLEDEQREFLAFLERLRQAKDKAEFDQFMSERNRPSPGAEAPSPS
jgi:Protein of unknown function (DUF2852)